MVSGVVVEEALEVQPECQHHWVIDTANGPTSWGICRRCAAKREFRNSCPGVEWEVRSGSEPFRSLPTYSLWWEQLSPLRLVPESELEGAGQGLVSDG